MTPRHIEIFELKDSGKNFAEIAEQFDISRARAQQIHAIEVAYREAVLAAPYILMLRAHSKGGVTVAGWLVKFMAARKLTTNDLVLKGAFWLGEQRGVGVGKVKLLAWALETYGTITSAESWLGGEPCLKS